MYQVTRCKRCSHNGEDQELMFLNFRDPRTLHYHDEDRAAMDETNWAVIVDELSVLADEDEDAEGSVYVLPRAAWEYNHRDELPAWADLHDCYSGDDCYAAPHVRADDGDAVELLTRLAGSMNDYPLLDEGAFSERESAAWDAWWNEDGFRDFLADALDIGYADALDIVDVLGDAAAEDLSYRVQSSLHYYYGFTGEYSVEPAREALTAWMRELQWLADEDARTMGGAQLVLVDIAPELS